MSSQFARDGRRRRVLNEESRIAASWQATPASVDAPAEAPRYGEMASVEHHPQISDYVPRRKRAVVATLTAGALVAVAAQTLGHFAEAVSGSLPGVSPAHVREGIAGGMVGWTAAIAMLAIAGLARLVYSLRRHRVDDVRGRYRVWKWIAWAGVVLSVNAVLGLHSILATAAQGLTGWSATSGHAEWWLAPAAIAGAWLGRKLLGELVESKSALAFATLAGMCYAAGAAGALGWSPAALGDWSDALVVAVPVVGHAFALATMMTFARYVVLDVQGLVDHAPRRAVKPKAESRAGKGEEGQPATIPARAVTPKADEDDLEEESHHEVRYLSKAERKRLRKQQRHAA